MVYEEELLAGNATYTIESWRAKGRLKPSALRALNALAHLEQALTASQLAGEARLSPGTAREVAKALVVHGYADRVTERVAGRAAYRISSLGQEAAMAFTIIAAQDEGARLSDPAYLEKQEIEKAIKEGFLTRRDVRSMAAKKRPGPHRVTRGPKGERGRTMVTPHGTKGLCRSCGRHHTLREHRHHRVPGETYRVSMGGMLFPGDPVPADHPFEFSMFNPPPQGLEFSVESKDNGTIEILALINMRGVGTIIVKPRIDDAVVISILVMEKWRRKHIATALYHKAAEVVSRYGMFLSSDTMREPAAEAFWRKQKIKGRATLEGGRYTLTEIPPKSLENPLDEEMRRAERSGDSAKLERMKARALGQQCHMIACTKPAVELFYLKWYGEEVPLCREHLDFAKRPAGSDENPRRSRPWAKGSVENPQDDKLRLMLRDIQSGGDPSPQVFNALSRAGFLTPQGDAILWSGDVVSGAFGTVHQGNVVLWPTGQVLLWVPSFGGYVSDPFPLLKGVPDWGVRLITSSRNQEIMEAVIRGKKNELDEREGRFFLSDGSLLPPAENPRRSRPWAKGSVEGGRTPLIPFEVFRDQEFMPIWRRAVASGKIPPSIIATEPTVLLTEQLTQLHCKNARRYAQVIPNRLQFEFALQTLWLPAAHRGGLIAHEIGHVLCPEGSEEDADRAAHRILGIKVTYDKRWPGKGLQKGRVVR